MAVTVDGNNLTFEGRVTVVNGANPETGVAYLILTPDGGFGNLPFLATGESGKPPVFDAITMTQVDPDEPLPVPNPRVITVSEGGPGVAAHYTMEFFIHSGQQGETGSIIISNAADLASSPTLGAGTDSYHIVYRASDGKWVPTAPKIGNMYVPTTIVSTAYNASGQRSLSSIAIPAQPFDWYPRPFAQVPVVGSADTRVDLVVRVGHPTTGDQVGYAKGVAGVSPPIPILIPAPPAGVSMPGGYGKVLAGNPAVVYLMAEQKAPSSNPWSTPGSPDATYCVEVVPVL
jgi:hypothetical protein